jgi:hypothetical protein
LLADGVLLPAETTEGNTMMVKVVCTCGHTGIVSAETLPRDLVCSRCGSSRRVEAGQPIVNKIAFQEWLLGEREAPRAQSR